MTHWTLQSSDSSSWLFNPHDHRLQGIRSTHQLSPWLSDYGQAIFMRVDAIAGFEASQRSSSYRPADTILSPAFLSVELLRYKARVQLAPTVRGAFMQVSFDELSGKEAGFAIQLHGADAEASLDFAAGLIDCSTSATAGGTPSNFRTYYALQFGPKGSNVVSRMEEHISESGRIFVARYKGAAGVATPIRIATSFISRNQARLNLETELQPFSFDEVKSAAEKTWNIHLGRAVVEGGDADQRRVFYSAMYRTLLFPRTWHEVDEHKSTVHFSAFNGKVEPGVMYADHGYWDVYRAWYPWMSMLFPERLGEILQAWVNAAREGGGWLPQFPSPGYRACMTGSLIDAVFADAAVKQINGFDLSAAYKALILHATTPGAPDRGYGRRGIESYLRLGYCAEGLVDQSAAETVDAAYGDLCIAQIAKALGQDEQAATFLTRSQNWRHLFDAKTGFLRGRREDGNWVEPFDPIRWGTPYVEGAAWQHRWDVPHDPGALFLALGGNAKAADQLEKMVSMAPDFHVGAYGQEIHEMSEMSAVGFGQYAHSNQPVHHVLYLFALAGRPDRTQY
jgi:predicted alpha-1,2-mannosidase